MRRKSFRLQQLRRASSLLTLGSVTLFVGACGRSQDAQATASQAAPAAVASERPFTHAITAGASAASRSPAPPPPSPSSDDPPLNATSLGLSCDKICSRSRALKCKNQDDCMRGCLGMGSLKPCALAFGSLYSCLEQQPLSHWECAPDGIAAIGDGFCDKEQSVATRCLERYANQ